MKKKAPSFHFVPFVFVLLVSIFVLLPLLHKGFFVTDDANWMVIRLSAFYQSFREGQFPVRFLGRLNNSYGYPVANFLYPEFMYIGSLLHFFGVSFVDSIKVIFAGSVLTFSGCIYLWLRTRFSELASAAGAVCSVCAPYLLFDLYSRGSVVEVLAMAWAAMGVYSLSAKKSWLFGLSITLLVVSHNSLALLFLMFFSVYITLFRLWKEVGLYFFLGVGMATFFWFPALYERKYVRFDATLVSNPADYFITLSNFTLLGVVGLIGGIVALLSQENRKREKIFYIAVVVFSVYMVLPFSGWLWNIPVLARVIQFPYRVLSLSVIAGAWLAAYAVEYRMGIKRWVLLSIFLGLSLWGVVDAGSRVSYVYEPEGYYATNEGTTTVHNEYMPKWVTVIPATRMYDRLTFYSGQGTIEKGRMTTQTIDTTVIAAEDSVLQINTMYYPGWGVTVDGAPVTIDYDNPSGLMRIPILAGRHHVVAGFRETISRLLADMVSLGCLIWFIVVGVLSVIHRKKS